MGQIMKEIGELLQASRESRGMEIGDISCQLKVSTAYLEALEKGDIIKLPEEVYVLGYLRGYARILGLDGDGLINRFQQDVDISAIRPNFVFPIETMANDNYRRTSRALPASVVMLVSCLMVLGVGAIWYQGKVLNRFSSFSLPIGQMAEGKF